MEFWFILQEKARTYLQTLMLYGHYIWLETFNFTHTAEHVSNAGR